VITSLDQIDQLLLLRLPLLVGANEMMVIFRIFKGWILACTALRVCVCVYVYVIVRECLCMCEGARKKNTWKERKSEKTRRVGEVCVCAGSM